MRSLPRVKVNKIRCLKCGDVVESKSVHDYARCSCGACAADGGLEYLRRTGFREDWEELGEYDVQLGIQALLAELSAAGRSFEQIKAVLEAEPYRLAVTEKDGFVMFADGCLDEPVCRECAGLILEKGSWRVVCYAFDRLFDVTDCRAPKLDWSRAVGYEKINGVRVSAFRHGGRLMLAADRAIDAYSVPVPFESGFASVGELWESLVKGQRIFFNDTATTEIYTFMIEPVPGGEPKLWHIGTRNTMTYEEYPGSIGAFKPAEIKCGSRGEFTALAAEKGALIVRDADYVRIKIEP